MNRCLRALGRGYVQQRLTLFHVQLPAMWEIEKVNRTAQAGLILLAMISEINSLPHILSFRAGIYRTKGHHRARVRFIDMSWGTVYRMAVRSERMASSRALLRRGARSSAQPQRFEQGGQALNASEAAANQTFANAGRRSNLWGSQR